MKYINLLWGGKFAAKIALNILNNNNDFDTFVYDSKLQKKFFEGSYSFLNKESEINDIFNKEELIKNIFICVGNNKIRKNIYDKLKKIKNLNFINLIADRISRETNIQLGIGNSILSGCNLDYDIKIGNFNIINNNVLLCHDTVVGNYNFIGPSVTTCGRVEIGNNVFIGAGTIIAPEVRIGNNSIIGAGSVIRKSIENNVFVAGNPQRKIKDI